MSTLEIISLYLSISIYNKFLVIVQSLNHVLLFTTSWTAARQAPLSFTFFWSLQYCSLQHWTSLSPADTSPAEHCLRFGPAVFLSGSISNYPSLFPSSILDTFQPGGSSSAVISFCLFILLMGLSRQEYWSGFPFPPPVEMDLFKFPADNIVLKFFWKKKKKRWEQKRRYCPIALPKVCTLPSQGYESLFSWYFQDWEWSGSFIYEVVCACSTSPCFSNNRGCTSLQICLLLCIFLWLFYFSVSLFNRIRPFSFFFSNLQGLFAS